MWQVYERQLVARRIRRLPVEFLKRYEEWKDVVALSGPPGLRLIRGFRDEQLAGDLADSESSRLGEQFRVIYCIEKDVVRVDAVGLAAHAYRGN